MFVINIYVSAITFYGLLLVRVDKLGNMIYSNKFIYVAENKSQRHDNRGNNDFSNRIKMCDNSYYCDATMSVPITYSLATHEIAWQIILVRRPNECGNNVRSVITIKHA